MAEEVKNVEGVNVEDIVKKVKDLQSARQEVATLNAELETHQKDLDVAEKIHGVKSKEYTNAKELVDVTSSKVADAEKKVADLTLKQSDLKPALDQLTKDFEDAYRKANTKEYHIEIASTKEGEPAGKGKKVFKQLLEYLYKNVSFTPKNAANLMLLVKNMEDNKPWVHSQEFDNVIILKSNNVVNLWRFIMEDMSGKGFYEARTFLECWANCGQSVSNAIQEIQKDNAESRNVASNLTLIEEEFNKSENDLPQDEQQTSTKDEVDPDVAE